ncbi:UNVERIFIED_ORG: hypothetical protein J2W38_006250 [Variovorax paradoxus]|nr:hypothetical protein [Variovorax paradoxus]
MLSFVRGLFDRKPGTEQVAKLLLRELQGLLPGEQFVLDLEQFLIRRADGGVIYLNNLYADYCQAHPAKRSGEITRFALAVASTGVDKPATLDEVKLRLLPILRRLGSVDLARIERGNLSKRLEDTMVWAPFSPTLGAAVAIDSDHAIAQVGLDDLKRWGIGFERAIEIAVDNLRHKTAPAFIEIGPGLYASNYRDYYDAGRIFLHELAWQLPLNGEPVAMVPNRSCLLVCGAGDAAALENMVTSARRVLREQSRPLSAEMFRLRDKTWSLWTPPGQAGALLATLQREEKAVDYNDQQEALTKAHAEAGIDVFVAKHTLLQRDADGSLVSFAVLPKGVDTWLPEADLVFLLETEGAAPTIVKWTDFSEHAAHLIERLPLAVPRWKVLGYPEGACLQRLRELATTVETVRLQ